MPTILEQCVTIAQAVDLLNLLIDGGDPVMLWGPPGIGKSEATHQIGATRGWKVIEYRANLREPVDVRGIPVPDLDKGTTRWLVPDELPRADRDGERGILFLDEINTASPQMMAVLFGLVLERRVGEYVLPAGWVIVAAGNRVSDRAAAQRMPTALRNRFAHIFIAPDVDAWCKWANRNNVAPEVVAFVRLRRELIHIMPKGDENAFPTPRSLTKAAKYVNAPKSQRLRLFASHVGDGVAAELDGFIELYRGLGSLEDIVASPDTAPVPTEASARYAVCTGLGRLATRKTLPNIIKYAKRLPRESQILVVHDATTRDEKLKETTAYGAWAVENQDIILQMS
jgi:MoxR-like ATPase